MNTLPKAPLPSTDRKLNWSSLLEGSPLAVAAAELARELMAEEQKSACFTCVDALFFVGSRGWATVGR